MQLDKTIRHPRLELRNITKVYPAVRASDAIDLKVAPGSIHAIVGENGAGKSTLMKIVFGMVRPDSGDVLWNGQEIRIESPADAQRLGIGMVFQHFALFDTLSVAENVLLASPPDATIQTVSARIDEIGARYGMPVAPDRPIYTMSMGERQRVEIIRALLRSPGLLILDEPTSVLTPAAIEALFDTLRRLSDEGCSILYISHKLEEIRDLCGTATVLRHGRVVGTCDPRQQTTEAMARMMIGASVGQIAPRGRVVGTPARLRVRGLSLTPEDPFATALRDVGFDVAGGEVLGIAGIAGNGQDTLMAALSGEAPQADREAVEVDGRSVGHLGPRERRQAGLASAPEDRLGRGAVPSLSLLDNALLTKNCRATVRQGLVRRGAVRAFAERCIASFDVRGGGAGATASSLSGGNLQKFIVAREVLQDPGVLVLAQPTWGVDVGAALAIRQALLDLRDAGAAVVVISEDLDELFEISDRIAVLAGGLLSEPFPRDRFDRNAIGLAMAGQRQVAGAKQDDVHAAAI